MIYEVQTILYNNMLSKPIYNLIYNKKENVQNQKIKTKYSTKEKDPSFALQEGFMEGKKKIG